MAKSTRKAAETDLDQIRHDLEIEIKRLTRYRLHATVENSSVAVMRLARAGVLTRKFAELVKKIVSGPPKRLSPEVIGDAPLALMILRVHPNVPA